jgi:protein-tyrosine phosphatase
VFRHLAARYLPPLLISVDSAGTLGHRAGEPPDERAQRVAIEHGIDLSGLRARELRPEDFDRFDLLLAMDRRNFNALRARAPLSRFDRLGMLVNYAPPPRPKEIPDPYYGTAEDFEQVFALTESAVAGLIRWLASEQAAVLAPVP